MNQWATCSNHPIRASELCFDRSATSLKTCTVIIITLVESENIVVTEPEWQPIMACVRHRESTGEWEWQQKAIANPSDFSV